MTRKIIIFFFTILIALAFSVRGMETAAASEKGHASLSPGQMRLKSRNQDASNEGQERAVGNFNFESNSSSEKRKTEMGGVSEDIIQQPIQSGLEFSSIDLLKTPPARSAVMMVRTEPRIGSKKWNEDIHPRKKMSGNDIDADELERLAWLNSDSIDSFSKTKPEFDQEKLTQKINELLSDPQKLKVVRKKFIAALEKCYGKGLIEAIFEEGEKESFLGEESTLTLEEANQVINKADEQMAITQSCWREFQQISKALDEKFQDLNIAQEEAQQAQENYSALAGSPWQHLVATIWYATRTVAGTVSTGCIIVLAVTLSHGVPVVLGVSSFVVGYLIEPTNLSRFVGCFFIPDNFNNMRASWGKFRQARIALGILNEQQKQLEDQRKATKKIFSDVQDQQNELWQKILPALQKELEQSQEMKAWSQRQKKIEGLCAQGVE